MPARALRMADACSGGVLLDSPEGGAGSAADAEARRAMGSVKRMVLTSIVCSTGLFGISFLDPDYREERIMELGGR